MAGARRSTWAIPPGSAQNSAMTSSVARPKPIAAWRIMNSTAGGSSVDASTWSRKGTLAALSGHQSL